MIVGSQAIHALYPDPPIDVVVGSREIDVVPLPYPDFEEWFFYVHEHFGADSEFDVENGVYIDMVREDVPTLPPDWETRSLERSLRLKQGGKTVTVVYPEIHDLLVAKLFANRPQDEAFLLGVSQIIAVDVETLRARLESVIVPPALEPKREWARACADRILSA